MKIIPVKKGAVKKIAIYNENCVMGGEECYNIEITDDGRALTEEEREFGDVTVYDVSEAEIERIEKMQKIAHAGRDIFLSRVARTLRDNLYV